MKGTTIQQLYLSYNTEFHARCYVAWLNGAGTPAQRVKTKVMKATLKKIRRKQSSATRMAIDMYWRDHSASMARIHKAVMGVAE